MSLMHGERITEPQALGLGNGKRDAVLKLQWYGRDEIVNNLLTPEEAAAGNVALYEQEPQCDVCEASRKRDISFIYDEAKTLIGAWRRRDEKANEQQSESGANDADAVDGTVYADEGVAERNQKSGERVERLRLMVSIRLWMSIHHLQTQCSRPQIAALLVTAGYHDGRSKCLLIIEPLRVRPALGVQRRGSGRTTGESDSQQWRHRQCAPLWYID